MPVDAVRLPDLWLKRDLLYALLAEGKVTSRVSGKVLIDCMRGSRGSLPDLSRLMHGDVVAGVKTDLYYLAALFEHLLVKGPDAKVDRAELDRFIQTREGGLALWPAPILGTFSEFVNAMLTLMRTLPHWTVLREQQANAALGRTVRAALREQVESTTDAAGRLRMLWGKQRNWALSSTALDRLIRQPETETPEIPEGDYVQIVVPGAAADQWVFGFELRTDDAVATAPWATVGSWFAPRLQRAGEAMALLQEYAEDDRNPTAIEPGEFAMRFIAVSVPPGINEPPTLPRALSLLTAGVPADWPYGYAQAMASVTYASRLNDARSKAQSKVERNTISKFGSKSTVPIPNRARLYAVDYHVVSGG